jgi:hypothetical protein
MATDLVINIASQFLGKKSFADADKATKKLTGSVKNLGRTLGVTLSAAAVLAYGKASVKAASEDIKAQRLLANTLKNVGLAYAAVDAESFISKMQSQTGVLDDQLRPAFAQLAGVTGSVVKTEKLLALAFDVSSGSTLDYASSVDLLAQAFVGNKKALKQLDLGYTQAELAAMSFDQIQQIINDRFAGSGKAALDTYIGQMSLLAVATNNAKEIIGTSLLGAIDSVGGSDGIDNLGKDIENAAKSLANFIDSIVYLKEQIATIPGAGIVKGVFGAVGNVLGRFSPQRAAELLKEIKGPQPFSQPMSLANQDTGRAALAASKKAELDAIKRNKELAKLANAQAKSAVATAKAKQLGLAVDKANLALGKGSDVFNMDAIQINAALISQAEQLGRATNSAQLLAIANDVARLNVKKSMYELEQAIASGDIKAIEAATARLNADIKVLGALTGQNIQLKDIQTILDALKPKELIDQKNLNDALLKIAEMIRLLELAKLESLQKPLLQAKYGLGSLAGDYIEPISKDVAAKASISAILEYADAATERANAFADLLDQQNAADEAALQLYMAKLGMTTDNSGALQSFRTAESASKVTVEVIDRTSGLIEVVQNAVQQNNRFGNNLSYAGAIAV